MRQNGRKVRGAVLNEDALIAAIRDLTGSQLIGDDAAVWQPSRSHRSMITTDALVEGVHFRFDTMTFYDAGWRAMAANVSDIAACGGRPVLATVALGLPKALPPGDVLDVYRGIDDVARTHHCAIAGGDITRANELTIAITIVGEVRASHFKGRSGARPGDVLAVTGALGASRAGLFVAQDGLLLEENLREAALASHRRPEPRLAEGRWLAASVSVRAMMDVSDGLSTDANRLCLRSGCAVVFDDVPVAAPARAAAQARGEDPRAFALAGGEDFELIAAVAPRAFTHLSARFAKRFGKPLHAAGVFREGTGLFVRNGDREETLSPSGWDHLA